MALGLSRNMKIYNESDRTGKEEGHLKKKIIFLKPHSSIKRMDHRLWVMGGGATRAGWTGATGGRGHV